MQEILLYWFAAQQQTSTLTWQNFNFFYAKFRAKSKKQVSFSKSNREGYKND